MIWLLEHLSLPLYWNPYTPHQHRVNVFNFIWRNKIVVLLLSVVVVVGWSDAMINYWGSKRKYQGGHSFPIWSWVSELIWVWFLHCVRPFSTVWDNSPLCVLNVTSKIINGSHLSLDQSLMQWNTTRVLRKFRWRSIEHRGTISLVAERLTNR